MKQSDIKRLEKVVEHYRKIEELLDKAYDSIEKGNIEYLEFADQARTQISTSRMTADILKDTATIRSWLEGRIKMIKEQLT